MVLGLLPEPGIETVVSAGVMRGGRLEPGIDFAWDWAGDAPAAEGRIRVQAASARLVIAPVVFASGRQRVDVRLRLSAGAGPMWASASGFAQVFSQTRLVVDGRVGVQVGLRVAGAVWVQIGGEVGWLPIRPSFEVRNADGTVETLFRAAARHGDRRGGPGVAGAMKDHAGGEKTGPEPTFIHVDLAVTRRREPEPGREATVAARRAVAAPDRRRAVSRPRAASCGAWSPGTASRRPTCRT